MCVSFLVRHRAFARLQVWARLQVSHRKNGGKKMKHIVSIVVLLSLVIALCGCARGEQVLLSNEVAEVVRTGREIRVTDVETGAEGVYIIVRAKRSTGSAAQESRVGNLTILSGRGVMIVTGNGASWIIRFGRS